MSLRAAFSSEVFMATIPWTEATLPLALAAASIKDLGGPVKQNLRALFLALHRADVIAQYGPAVTTGRRAMSGLGCVAYRDAANGQNRQP